MDETGKEYSDMAKFYTAVVTVFHEDGTLDYEGNKAVYEHLIQAGSDGIVLMGSTGEFCSMTMDMAKSLQIWHLIPSKDGWMSSLAHQE